MRPMRLVDIGNLNIRIQYPRCNGKTVVIDAIEKALNELPTVDAIPVELVEKYKKACETMMNMEEIGSDKYLHWHRKIIAIQDLMDFAELEAENEGD